MFIFLFVMTMLIPFTMIVFGMLWKSHPPKNINWAYGYRTTMSMKNKETWDFAHKFLALVWFYCGAVIAVISAILLIIFKNSDDFENMVTVLVLVQLVVLCLAIIPTEIALNKHFNKNGYPKE